MIDKILLIVLVINIIADVIKVKHDNRLEKTYKEIDESLVKNLKGNKEVFDLVVNFYNKCSKESEN